MTAPNSRCDRMQLEIEAAQGNADAIKVLGLRKDSNFLLTSPKLAASDSPDRGVILLWGEQRRIITHFDVLRRLFEGVVTTPAAPAGSLSTP